MLYNSFYFGGLGIQRVVATLSSSNICALALGASLLYFLVWNPIFNVKYEAIMIVCIAVAFSSYVFTLKHIVFCYCSYFNFEVYSI